VGSFQAEVVVITGAAQGIGRATATLLKARGAHVIAMNIDREKLSDPQGEPGLADDQVIVLDLGEEEISWSDYERTLRVNLFGAIWSTQTVIVGMKEHSYGRIVHLASIAGKEGNPGMAPYNTSKSGLIGFVKVAAKEASKQCSFSTRFTFDAFGGGRATY
jgi:3-oxoacyl-[acyl-carrier protein] reductase